MFMTMPPLTQGQQRLLTPESAAQYLGVTVPCLVNWRMSGKGPKYIRLARTKVAYAPEDLEAFIESRRFAQTSEDSVLTGAGKAT